MCTRTGWVLGYSAWEHFTKLHPELGYKPGRMNFHNFLRLYRDHLKQADVIRLAKRQFWVAHEERFCAVAFDCATGAAAQP